MRDRLKWVNGPQSASASRALAVSSRPAAAAAVGASAAADPQKSLRDAASGYRGLATLGTRGGVGAPFAGHNVG